MQDGAITTANPAESPTELAATPEAPKINKMNKARKIFNEVQAQHEEGIIEKPRAEFIKRAMAELDMSKSGASTYYHNISRFKKGEDPYKHNKAANKKAAARKREEKAANQVETTEQPEAPVVEIKTTAAPAEDQPILHRWRIGCKTTGEVIDSFTTRTAAQAEVKTRNAAGENTRWIDGDKEAKAA